MPFSLAYFRTWRLTPTQRRKERRASAKARFVWHLHRKGLRLLTPTGLAVVHNTLANHHYRDPSALRKLRGTMANSSNAPWRCHWSLVSQTQQSSLNQLWQGPLQLGETHRYPLYTWTEEPVSQPSTSCLTWGQSPRRRTKAPNKIRPRRRPKMPQPR